MNADKRRMVKRMMDSGKAATISSYLGSFSHGNTYRSRQKIFGNISNF
jgi:hypothetical protein